MARVLTTKELEAFKPGAGMEVLTAKRNAPNGVKQRYPGEFSRHVIVESFEEAAMKSAANGILWPVVKEFVFTATRQELLKARLKAGDEAKGDVNPFSLNFDSVIKALTAAQSERLGKLSPDSIKSWAQSSGLLDALTDARVAKLSPENQDNAEAIQACIDMANKAINQLSLLAGEGLKLNTQALDMCSRLLSYAQEDAMSSRLMERISSLAVPVQKSELLDSEAF